MMVHSMLKVVIPSGSNFVSQNGGTAVFAKLFLATTTANYKEACPPFAADVRDAH